MLKVNVDVNCGNSPKMAFLRDVNIAFAKTDTEYLSGAISDDVEWDMVGDTVIKGKPAFLEIIRRMSVNTADELTIYSIITHGKDGSVNGVIHMTDGRMIHFSDVYHFTSAKGNCIKSLKSYVIEQLPQDFSHLN